MAKKKSQKSNMVVFPDPHSWGDGEGRTDVSPVRDLSRLSRAFYQNMPGIPVTYYRNEVDAVFVNVLGTTTQLLVIDIPRDMVFDLVYVSFRFLIRGVDAIYVRAHDFFTASNVVFHIVADGTNPLAQENTYGGQLVQSGFRRLNGNVFDTDDDMKYHHVFEGTRRLVFDYTVVLGGLAPPDNSQCGVEVRGLWVPQAVWNDMKEDLR